MVNETKREKFVRIAEARTNKILNMIQLLGNCSNQKQYEYTQKDVNKIFNAIQTEVDEAKKRYSKQDSQKGSKFTLEKKEILQNITDAKNPNLSENDPVRAKFELIYVDRDDIPDVNRLNEVIHKCYEYYSDGDDGEKLKKFKMLQISILK